jgi:hypothetical protein
VPLPSLGRMAFSRPLVSRAFNPAFIDSRIASVSVEGRSREQSHHSISTLLATDHNPRLLDQRSLREGVA